LYEDEVAVAESLPDYIQFLTEVARMCLWWYP
jgi:hypothetical protein